MWKWLSIGLVAAFAVGCGGKAALSESEYVSQLGTRTDGIVRQQQELARLGQTPALTSAQWRDDYKKAAHAMGDEAKAIRGMKPPGCLESEHEQIGRAFAPLEDASKATDVMLDLAAKGRLQDAERAFRDIGAQVETANTRISQLGGLTC